MGTINWRKRSKIIRLGRIFGFRKYFEKKYINDISNNLRSHVLKFDNFRMRNRIRNRLHVCATGDSERRMIITDRQPSQKPK